MPDERRCPVQPARLYGRFMPTKASGKKAAAKPEAGKANALQQPLRPSKELAEVVSKVWEYIRSHNLQNPEDRREILAGGKLGKVFGKDKVTMFEMNKCLAQHLK
jgi:upstream activation factor subunit UAF30